MARPSTPVTAAIALIVAVAILALAGPQTARAAGEGLTVRPGLCNAAKGPTTRVFGYVVGCTASGTAPDELAARAADQKWTTFQNDDVVAIVAWKAVMKRINRAWDAAKATIPDSAVLMRARQSRAYEALLAVNAQVIGIKLEKADKDLDGATKRRFADANTQYSMLQPRQMWDQESGPWYYDRLDAALSADKKGLSSFQDEVDDQTGAKASAATKALCSTRTAFSNLVDHGTSRRVKEAGCRANLAKNAKDAVGDTVGKVGGWIGDQLWKGVLGPIVKEVNEAATWAAAALAKQMDRLVDVDFDKQWMTTLVARSAGVAMIVGVLFGLMGLIGAAMRSSGREAGEVLGRAMTIGVVTGGVLSVMQIASGLATAFTQIMVGRQKTGTGPIAQLAETFTKSLVDDKVPELVALIFLLLLLSGLLLLMLELAFRGPLLLMLALLYPPIYASSALRPGREVLQRLNALVIGLLLVPFVAVLGLQVAMQTAGDSDDWLTLLVAICALLAAASLPLLVMVLIEPASGFMAGMSGRAAMGQAAKAGRSGAGIGGAAASGAKRSASAGAGAAKKAAKGGGRMVSNAASAVKGGGGSDGGSPPTGGPNSGPAGGPGGGNGGTPGGRGSTGGGNGVRPGGSSRGSSAPGTGGARPTGSTASGANGSGSGGGGTSTAPPPASAQGGRGAPASAGNGGPGGGPSSTARAAGRGRAAAGPSAPSGSTGGGSTAAGGNSGGAARRSGGPAPRGGGRAPGSSSSGAAARGGSGRRAAPRTSGGGAPRGGRAGGSSSAGRRKPPPGKNS